MQVREEGKAEACLVRVLPFRQGPVRFVALVVLALTAVGELYTFNIPQAIEESFKEQLEISESQFELLYTYYALPNIFTTVLLGAFMDIVGIRIGVVLMACTLAIGQSVCAFGAGIDSFGTILAGRVIAGISAESLMTAQTALVCLWFAGQQLAIAVGVAITLPEIGDALNSVLTPEIMEATGSLSFCLWVGVIISVISVGFGVGALVLDIRADKYDEEHGLEKAVLEGEEESVKLSDIREMSLAFWLMILNLSFTLGVYIPFMDNANSYFQKRFCFTQTEAGKATMITYMTSVITALPLGALIDRTGFRRRWILLDCCVLLLAHFIMWVYPNCHGSAEFPGIIGLFFMGVAYSLYATAMLPCPSKMVPDRVIGTAYGIEAMASSFAMGIFPLFSSLIQDSKEDNEQAGSRYSALMYTCMAVVNCLIAGSLFVFDRKNTDLLDLVEEDFERVMQERQDEQLRLAQLEAEQRRGLEEGQKLAAEPSSFEVSLMK